VEFSGRTAAEIKNWRPLLSWSVLVGAFGFSLSLARLLVVNHLALTNLLWAEDGLFPLCVRKVGFGACLIDPFAGYLLFLPRAVAGGVSMLPLEAWPLGANLAAALIAGVASGFVFGLMQSAGRSFTASSLLALLPVLAPIVGFEAIGAVGSSYMLLLYATTLAISFPTNGKAWASATFIGLLTTTLTIPSAILLLLPLWVQYWRRRVTRAQALTLSGALIIGLAAQVLVASTAMNQRNIGFRLQDLQFWIQNMPNAVATYVPGVSFGSPTVFGQFELSGWFGQLVLPNLFETGLVFVIAVTALGTWLVARDHTRTSTGIGMLLLTGLALGAIPSLTGSLSNRYFVDSVLLWAAAGVIAIDTYVVGGFRLGRARRLVLPVAAVLLVVLWLPAFGASPWRATAFPPWPQALDALLVTCATDQGGQVSVVLSPEWPYEGLHMFEPTAPAISCALLFIDE
jgi:hypothetical protein